MSKFGNGHGIVSEMKDFLYKNGFKGDFKKQNLFFAKFEKSFLENKS